VIEPLLIGAFPPFSFFSALQIHFFLSLLFLLSLFSFFPSSSTPLHPVFPAFY
jgi:hypothetical protein